MLSVQTNGGNARPQGGISMVCASPSMRPSHNLDAVRSFGIACRPAFHMTKDLSIYVLPSLLAADKGQLAEECERVEAGGADGIHADVMDGHFVANLSMGPDIVKMARQHIKGHLSVHLMVAHPQDFVDVFADSGADTILIHVEACCRLADVLQRIRRRGARAGLTLNPETPADSLLPFRDMVDEILCMTVHPGFGGQRFIPEVLPKINEIRAAFPNTDISVDGGITSETAGPCAAQGANIFLAGTAVFAGKNSRAEIEAIRRNAAAHFRRGISQ
jgi:ribulose-phosphate 3-epimerase